MDSQLGLTINFSFIRVFITARCPSGSHWWEHKWHAGHQ